MIDEHKQNILEYLNWCDEDMKKLMWLFYYIQFCTKEDFSDNIWQLDDWKIPAESEALYPGMFKAVVYLVASENLKNWLSEHELPEEMLDAYFDRYRYMVKLNLATHNTNGLCRLSPFCYSYANPFNIRIGRLGYQLIRYYEYCEVYENEAGERKFVPLPWRKYAPDGHIDPNGKLPTYINDGKKIICNFYRPDGTLSFEETTVDLGEYHKILSPGDRVATIHIPEGGKLSTDIVMDSLKSVWKLINTHFEPIKAFVCRTWFIAPGLSDVIKPDSNMAKFANLFGIICTEDNENHSIFEYIFVTKRTELTNLVPQNEFQRKMLDVAHVSDLTGIECSEVYDNTSPMFRIDKDSHEICENLDARQIFGAFLKARKGSVGFIPLSMARSYLYPLIYPTDKDGDFIAHYAQTGLPAVCVKNVGGYTSVYCGSKYISADFIREVARFADCHIYDEDGHVFCANDNFITVHASKSGTIKLSLKKKCSPYELYENKFYGENTDCIEFYAECGETKMFQLKN